MFIHIWKFENITLIMMNRYINLYEYIWFIGAECKRAALRKSWLTFVIYICTYTPYTHQCVYIHSTTANPYVAW